MKRAIVVVALLVAACGGKPAPGPTLVKATELACPDRPADPRPLPRVRTPAQIGDYATRVELAREAERDRGNECAGSLHTLLDLAVRNGWIALQ